MALITADDWRESWSRLEQRGWGFLWSKFNPNGLARTRSTFGDEHLETANWWIVPAVRQRWNKLITGDPGLRYEDYFVEKYLGDRQGLRMLSLGCGIASHERYLASFSCFEEITAIDLSSKLIEAARRKAQADGLENIQFEVADINDLELPADYYDVVMFHASLHHFKNLQGLIGRKIPHTLKTGGLLLINEYVGPNRLQWPAHQVEEANRLLKELVPTSHRSRFRSHRAKNHLTGPGWLRMLISDPSEAVESESILPLLHEYFTPLEEKPYGGNLLVLILKDIAHHFVDETHENQAILSALFKAEDKWLKQQASMMLFGVYSVPASQ